MACGTRCSHKHAWYMQRERLLLQDIVAAADAIAEFTAQLQFEAFISNHLVQSAVVYQLVVIGEAAIVSRHRPGSATQLFLGPPCEAYATSSCTTISESIGTTSGGRRSMTCLFSAVKSPRSSN